MDPMCPDPDDAVVFTDANRGVGLAFFVAACVYFPVSIAWWLRYRESTLLRKRSFGLMLVSALGIMFHLTVVCLTNFIGARELPCAAKLVFTFFFIPVAIGPFVVRLVLFYNQSRFEDLVARTRGEGFEAFSAWAMTGDRNTTAEAKAFLRTAVCCCLPARILDGPADEGVRGTEVNGRVVSRAFNQLTLKKQKGGKPGDFAVGPAGGDLEEFATAASTAGMRRAQNQTQAALFRKSGAYAVLAQLLVTLLAVVAVLYVALRPGSPFAVEGCVACSFEFGDFLWIPIPGILLAIVSLYMLVKLRGSRDPLGILRELYQCFGAGVLILIGAVVSAADPGGFYAPGLFDFLYVSSLGCFVLFTVQCPLQVWRAKKDVEAKDSRRATMTLSAVLGSPALKRALEEYLASEWSSENGVFLDMVQRYKDGYGDEPPRESASRALEIFTTCLRDRSMLEVNVSHPVRRALTAKLTPLLRMVQSADLGSIQVPGEDVFDEAYKEIFDLIETDSMPRFLHSSLYRKVAGTA